MRPKHCVHIISIDQKGKREGNNWKQAVQHELFSTFPCHETGEAVGARRRHQNLALDLCQVLSGTIPSEAELRTASPGRKLELASKDALSGARQTCLSIARNFSKTTSL